MGSGGWILIQQLMVPSMSSCLTVWLSSYVVQGGAGWLHIWAPWSRSRRRLSESWGETGASLSQTLIFPVGPWG